MAGMSSIIAIVLGVLPVLLYATTDCGNSLKPHQREKFIKMHNVRRANLAKGLVQKANGNYLPTASNMYKMDNNCTLEETAIERAESCFTKTVALPPDVVENIAWVDLPVANKTVAIQKGVSSWWKQIRTAPNIGNLVYYRTTHTEAENFVQMAWATTDKLGCAVHKCSSFYAVACHYASSEVSYDEQIYLPGPVCTNCPSELKTCYDGALCAP